MISPIEPQAGLDDLVGSAQYDAVDLDGDNVEISFAWEADGQPTAYTTETIPEATPTQKKFGPVLLHPMMGPTMERNTCHHRLEHRRNARVYFWCKRWYSLKQQLWHDLLLVTSGVGVAEVSSNYRKWVQFIDLFQTSRNRPL